MHKSYCLREDNGLIGKVLRIAAAAVLIIVADVIFEVSVPAVNEISISTEKLEKGKGITLLQISDFHGNPSKKLVKRIVKAAVKAGPDAVLITGDLVDSKTEDFGNVYTLIKGLHSVCPSIFFVSGNHEWSNDYRKDFLRKLAGLDVVLLNNKGTVFVTNEAEINLCGVDDPYTYRDNIAKAMRGIDTRKYTVLLAHSPRIRDRLGQFSPDLILCGHVHGGQVRLPFIGAVIAPGEGLLPVYDKGMFELDRGTKLYIDSGVGTSHLPIRFLNRSQISVIRITGK